MCSRQRRYTSPMAFFIISSDSDNDSDLSAQAELLSRIFPLSATMMGPGQLNFPGLPANLAGLQLPLMYPGGLPQELSGGAGAFPGFAGFESPFFHPYGLDGSRRKNATRETTAPLKEWLNNHRKNPYPTKGEKVYLAMLTKMTMTQVSTWFANARRRLKKENKLSPQFRGRNDEDDDDENLDRPSSSQSGLSDDAKEDIDISIDDHEKDETAPLGDVTPCKKKIWSIVDMTDEKKTENPMSKKESPMPDEAASLAGLQFLQQQQLMMMAAKMNPQLLASMGMPPGARMGGHAPAPQGPPGMGLLFPLNQCNIMQMMALAQQQHQLMNGSFTSEVASISPSSSRSPSSSEVKPEISSPVVAKETTADE